MWRKIDDNKVSPASLDMVMPDLSLVGLIKPLAVPIVTEIQQAQWIWLKQCLETHTLNMMAVVCKEKLKLNQRFGSSSLIEWFAGGIN